ncbi:MAG: PaaI family thioesterase [Acidimicrobiales bacterium]|nr:PaaI family thioesterase [Acidimicrobiales bacterium]
MNDVPGHLSEDRSRDAARDSERADGSGAHDSTADAGERLEPVRGPLYSRWQEPPPSMMTTRRVEMRRLADSMRIIIERLVATAAPTEKLIEVADELARVALMFDQFPHGTLYEGFAEAANVGGDLHASFEHSPFIGRANPLAPPIYLQEIDGVVHGRAIFGSAYEGPPGCVHGGYVAAAFDELLGATQSMSGNPGMTGTLTVKYRSPTPLHTELHFVGELVRVEGRKIFTEGRVYAGDRLCAEAEAIFISIDFSKFAELKAQREAAERARLAAEG